MTRTLAILGATGSIGTQALDVLAAHPDAFEVAALGGARRLDELAALARAHRPRAVVVATAEAAATISSQLPDGTELLVGPDGLAEVAGACDVVLNAVVGFAGLPATLAALSAGRHLALANKESLVVAAPLVAAVRDTPGARLLPVDSEHCAVHQCLAGLPGPDPIAMVRRLVLTASGGPFRGRSPAELETVTVADALAHPTWQMGARITVDCSTLLNKGFEVLEAAALFELPADRVDVVVHPQSIVHSMVELVDGSTIAQLSQPDMRLPIGYAMGWPERLET
ncbi:MAG TPA: 1-deoxy-D-xylulose-5-phosphate reductoisomerase, partial [Acidimicrobiales bacterium]|nr:1-deoxy-D-xylulose-5-phosphate reductoisomerase [Acidimicrobiales bacterium]